MLRRRFPVHVLLLLVLLLSVGTAARLQQAETTTTVILVRHAEKAAEPREDPPLTPVGEARAAALIDAIGTAGIMAVYSTPWKRTQQTAAPIATKLGILVTTFDVTPGEKSYGELYAAELLKKHRGRVVLVVGHSNTVPAIARALGVTDVRDITDAEYDNLLVVTIPATGPVRAVKAKYGPR